MKIPIFICLMLASLLQSAVAQDGFIYGIVMDQNGKPIANASIWAVGEKVDFEETITDAKGGFKFFKLQEINYNLTVNAYGYYPYECSFVNSRLKGKVKIKMYDADPSVDGTVASIYCQSTIDLTRTSTGMIFLMDEMKDIPFSSIGR
jgi:hypothetical protein